MATRDGPTPPPTIAFDDSFTSSPLAATFRHAGSIDGDRREDWRSKWRSNFKWSQSANQQPKANFQRTKANFQRTKERICFSFITSFKHCRVKLGPFSKGINFRKQCVAFFLVFAFGVLPIVVFAQVTQGFQGPNTSDFSDHSGYDSYGDIFSTKIQYCQQNVGNHSNLTSTSATDISGIENVFVLDRTFNRKFSFSTVKIIDASWDILIGRAVQLLASWAAYVVFSDALLRIIELHPASFQIFQKIGLEGPRLSSTWALVKETLTAKSKRAKVLFIYMLFSTLYITWIPPWLSAMTGYDTSSVLWFAQNGSTNMIQINSTNSMNNSFIIIGTRDENFERKPCINESDALSIIQATGNSTFGVPINGIVYNAANLTFEEGYCYNSVGYTSTEYEDNLSCLSDTDNKAYMWGFSSVLSGLFVIFQLTWTLSMYVVWQDAQFNSTLVKSGYNMTRLRAAFALTDAAKLHTGLSDKELLQADKEEVKRGAYGGKNSSGASLDYNTFAQPADGKFLYTALKRRNPNHKSEAAFSEVTLA